MPTIFRHRGYRVYFYSNEGDPREPPHVHIEKGQADAKIWLVPSVGIAYNRGHPPRVLRELTDLVTHRRQALLEAWHEFFSEGEDGSLR